MRRFRQDRRGINNVVTAMLGLIIVVIIVANVFIWNYEMNQVDLERTHENLKINEVARVNSSSWFSTQSEYEVDIGTKVQGTYSNTLSMDGTYESLAEGLNWWNASYAYRKRITITNNGTSELIANYSVAVAIDTASLVSSGKVMSNGNDMRVVFWTGSSWIELDRDVVDFNTNSTQVWFETKTAILGNSLNDNYFLHYGNPSAGSPPSNRSNVYLWFDNFDRADNPNITTEAAYGVKTGGGVWSIENGTLKNVGSSGDPNKLLITSLGSSGTGIDMLTKIRVASFAGGDLSRMGLSCFMDTDPSRGSGYCGLFYNDRNSLDILNDLRSWGSHVSFSWSLNTWYYVRFRVIDPLSRLGEMKVWQVGSAEPSTWTLIGDFGGGAARSFGEIGFAGSRISDTTYFDDIVIRTITSGEPLAFLGTEETQTSNSLMLKGVFVADIGTYPLDRFEGVEVQMVYRSSDVGEKWYIEAYNWTSLAYSDSGFNSTDGNLPTTGWDNYSVNFTSVWNSYVNQNGTVYLRVSDRLADDNKTTIDIDFLAIRAVVNGARFSFENTGSVTLQIVALWIDNATYHKRYEISLYANSGETISYLRFDLKLPEKPYLVKVTTERGNIAVYSGD